MGPDRLPETAGKVDDDEVTSPVESGRRAFGHSKDFRADLPQVVIAMAVTRDGTPVRCRTFAGNESDTAIIRTIKDDLAGWNLRRVVWVADPRVRLRDQPGLPHQGRRHYIHAEKLRRTSNEAAAALARQDGTAPWPATCASRKSPSRPAATATATAGPARSGS